MTIMKVLDFKKTVMVMAFMQITFHGVYSKEPQDCLVYESSSDADEVSPPPLVLHNQVTMGVSGTGPLWNAKLSLTSLLTNGSCDLLFVSNTVAVSCADENGTSMMSSLARWPRDVFVPGEFTELWLRLGDPSSSPPSSSSSSSSSSPTPSPSPSPSSSFLSPEVGSSDDLYLLGRRGHERGFLLVPSTGLAPPLSLRWENQNFKYYYNCATGCLKDTQVTTPSGLHTVFLLMEHGLQNLTFSYTPKVLRPQPSFAPVSLNVLLSVQDLKEVPVGSWANITVVWNILENTIGALVNSNPVGSLRNYNILSKSAVLEGWVEGGGYLTLCDPRFQLLQEVSSREHCMAEVPDDVTLDVTSGDGSSTSSLTSSSSSSSSSSGLDVAQTNQVLLVLCILLLIVLLALLSASYARISAKLRALGVDSNGEVKGHALVRRRSSTYSKVRCSVKASRAASDDGKESSVERDECKSLSDATVAMSDVTCTPMATPLATPDASAFLAPPRSSKVVSTSEFIDIDIGT